MDIQSDRRGAHHSGLTYTTRQTLMLHLLEQGKGTAQGPMAQATTTWHRLICKLLLLLTTITSRTWSTERDCFTLINSCSMVGPLIHKCARTVTTRAPSALILLLAWSRWEISAHSLDPAVKLGRIAGGSIN